MWSFSFEPQAIIFLFFPPKVVSQKFPILCRSTSMQDITLPRIIENIHPNDTGAGPSGRAVWGEGIDR
jgi:hypothetical protein